MSAAFSPPDLKGKVAVITGASRGIGKSVALALAGSGCNICVAARSTESSEKLPGTIDETVAAIRALGREAIAIRTDVREESEIDAAMNRAATELGGVDIFIHNAGVLFWKDVIDTPIRRFDLLMDVNVRAAFAGCRAAIPFMRERGGGHIVVYSPPVDLELLKGKVAYFISKYGMTMVAHGLAEELRGDTIAVNALWPATLIESQATINHRMGGPQFWRKPDIVADATLALLGRNPAECTGQALLDEEVLRQEGVDDFSTYNCVPGGKPMYIAGTAGRATWNKAKHRLSE